MLAENIKLIRRKLFALHLGLSGDPYQDSYIRSELEKLHQRLMNILTLVAAATMAVFGIIDYMMYNPVITTYMGFNYTLSLKQLGTFLLFRIVVVAFMLFYHLQNKHKIHSIEWQSFRMSILALSVSSCMSFMALTYPVTEYYYYQAIYMIIVGTAIFFPGTTFFYTLLLLAMYCTFAIPILVLNKMGNIYSFIMSNCYFISISIMALTLRFVHQDNLIVRLQQDYKLKQSLISSSEQFNAVVSNANIGIYRHNGYEGNFLQANPAMAMIFGFDSVAELMSVKFATLYQNTKDRDAIIDKVLESGFIKDVELAMKKKDNTPIWCSATVTVQRDANGNILCMDGILEDITERKNRESERQRNYDELEEQVKKRTYELAQANERLREQSEQDFLTMILNRRRFYELLTNEILKAKRYQRPLSLIMIDVDHFKCINDKFGHGMGDIVLVTITREISKMIRNTDIFARYGGEELVILLPETDCAGAASLGDKIRESIASYSFITDYSITISCGVHQMDNDDTENTLVEKADAALYLAKNNGRNRIEVSCCPTVNK